MKLPPRQSSKVNPNLMCELHISIYDLKQIPRTWHAKFINALEAIGLLGVQFLFLSMST